MIAIYDIKIKLKNRVIEHKLDLKEIKFKFGIILSNTYFNSSIEIENTNLIYFYTRMLTFFPISHFSQFN